ncbi:hypothetical protein [Ruegeria sp. HKCCD7255]|uniref:hypothetical protein n=1 Tax=Ruegeria sp. HKCCD7255 TaxID=2683004 RepID=UPI00148961F8|nr:hypothetical protein [Ruegeria sp. HKCCD7255]
MTDRRLSGIVTALLLLSAASGVRAEITIDQLLIIDQYLSSNDTQSLYAYLQRNPQIMAGNDELSIELRNFYQAASAGSLDFDYSEDQAAAPDTTSTESATQSSALQH